MIKHILLTLIVGMVGYIPVWAAEQFNEITDKAERLRTKLEEEST